MTANQWKLLKILDHWGGHGTMEVEIAWGGYDFGDDEAGESKGWRVNRLVVAGLMRGLAAKGLAIDDKSTFGGYDITERGRELLAKHAKRLAERTTIQRVAEKESLP